MNTLLEIRCKRSNSVAYVQRAQAVVAQDQGAIVTLWCGPTTWLLFGVTARDVAEAIMSDAPGIDVPEVRAFGGMPTDRRADPERAEFVVNVDTTQAQASLDQMRERLAGLQKQAERMKERSKKFYPGHTG